MQDSSQQQTTVSGHRKVGRPLGSVPPNKFPSVIPELAGRRFGKLLVVSGMIVRNEKGRPYVETECSCGKRSFKDVTSILQGSAGCRTCGQPVRFPRWLWARCENAKMRCDNTTNSRYRDYGGRGIRFNFPSASAMALWIQEHLGVHRELTLDRINNEGNYEPGNLRWATNSQQQCNRRVN